MPSEIPYDFLELSLQVTDHTNAMLAYWDKDLICRFANKAYRSWFGIEPRQMINKMTIKELLGPLYEKNLPYIRRVLKGEPQIFERDITTPSGEIRSSIAQYIPHIVDKSVKGFFVHVADVTSVKAKIKDHNEQEYAFGSLPGNENITLQVAETLRSSLTEGFPGIPKLARQHYTSESKLKRDFKKIFNVNIYEYFRNLQMELADVYINENKFSKKQVARLLNFSNASNFSVCYQKYLKEGAERKIKDAIQKATDENYITFIAQSPFAIAMFDNEMKFLCASQKWIDDNLLQGKKIQGLSVYSIFPNIEPKWKKIYAYCLKGNISKGEERSYKNDKTLYYLRWDIRPWYNNNVIGGLLLFTEDMSELRKKDEDNLLVNKMLNKAVEIAGIGTWERDLITNRAIWSEVTREILEVPAGYDINSLDTAIFFKERKSGRTARKAMTLALKKGKAFDIEAELLSFKNNIKKVRLVGYPEFAGNRCIKIFGIIQQIAAKT
jgi:PAS domain S-box-containing protein